MIIFREIVTQEPASIICDRCGRSAQNVSQDFEFQEFLSIRHECGYGSIVGDGMSFQIDFCQYCLKELLLPYAKVTKQ